MKKENREYDINRDVTLNEVVIEIIRLTNNQVINRIEQVIEEIKKKIGELNYKADKSPFRGFRGIVTATITKHARSPLGDLGAL